MRRIQYVLLASGDTSAHIIRQERETFKMTKSGKVCRQVSPVPALVHVGAGHFEANNERLSTPK